MGLYAIARRLNATPGAFEGFIGVEVSSQRPVLARRLASAWHPTLDSETEARLARLTEADAPGVTRTLDVGTADGQLWLIQALVDGEPLRQTMQALARQRGILAPSEGLAVVARIAALLAALHERPDPFLHGDVCAGTILLLPDGNVMLSDATASIHLGPGPLGPVRSEAPSLAPERLVGGATPATDVFHLGLVLYELAMGRPLFSTPDPTLTLSLCQRYPGLTEDAVRQVPPPWRTLLTRTLAVDPEARITAAELDRSLAEGMARAGWGRPETDLQALFLRAFPGRNELLALARGGSQMLELAPLRRPPAAEGNGVGRSPTLGASRAPPAPTPRPLPHLSPPAPGSAVVGRIATRKVPASALVTPRGASGALRVPAAPPREPEEPAAPRDEPWSERLVEQAIITRAQLDHAQEQVAALGGSLAEALSTSGACEEDAIVAAVAGATKTPHVTTQRMALLPPPAEALALVSLELSRRLDVVPLGLKGGTQLLVAMKDPLDSAALEALKAATGLKSIVAMRAGESALRCARERFYGHGPAATPDAASRLEPLTPERLPRTAPVPVPGSGRLASALLPLLGDAGQDVLRLASGTAAVAARLGASAEEVGRAHLAALAVGIANLTSGRRPFDVPPEEVLRPMLGEGEWCALEALVRPWLRWPSSLPAEPPAQAIVLAFGLSLHAHQTHATPEAALASFRTRYQLDESLVGALTEVWLRRAPT